MAGTLLEIGFNDLEFYERCGGGTYGSVYRALWKSEKKEVAVKKLLCLDAEAQVLSIISHRNIIKFYGAVTKSPNFSLVTEYAHNGSLYAFLRIPGLHLDFTQILEWARQIALGINYLHSEAPVPIIHRDLKSKNIVISKEFICKICDFGCSKFFASTTKMSLAGTFPWMAPEVIQSQPVSETCDTWSFGVVLWELLTQEIPFEGIEGFQVAWVVVEKGERLTIPSACPASFATLMKRCWNVDPKKRPSFRQMLISLDNLLSDDMLPEETNLFLENRDEWKQEIEDTLNRLKKAEQVLRTKEIELQDRERKLTLREKDLEKQFGVVNLEAHDVQTWREIDVFQWLQQVASANNGNMGELCHYGDLFLNNNITGKTLLLLTENDLIAMGVESVGHRKDLQNEIELLRVHNFRLLHFPPLIQTQMADVTVKPVADRVLNVTFMIGNHVRHGTTALEHKWKMYVEVDEDENDDDMDDVSIFTCIRDIAFICREGSYSQTYRVSQPPYVMEKWKVGISEDMFIECVITYELDKVKLPRVTKCNHKILTCGTSDVIHKSVNLMLKHKVKPVEVISPTVMSQNANPVSGVWGKRVLQNSVCPIEVRTPGKWAAIVSGQQVSPPVAPGSSRYLANRRLSYQESNTALRPNSTVPNAAPPASYNGMKISQSQPNFTPVPDGVRVNIRTRRGEDKKPVTFTIDSLSSNNTSLESDSGQSSSSPSVCQCSSDRSDSSNVSSRPCCVRCQCSKSANSPPRSRPFHRFQQQTDKSYSDAIRQAEKKFGTEADRNHPIKDVGIPMPNGKTRPKSWTPERRGGRGGTGDAVHYDRSISDNSHYGNNRLKKSEPDSGYYSEKRHYGYRERSGEYSTVKTSSYPSDRPHRGQRGHYRGRGRGSYYNSPDYRGGRGSSGRYRGRGWRRGFARGDHRTSQDNNERETANTHRDDPDRV